MNHIQAAQEIKRRSGRATFQLLMTPEIGILIPIIIIMNDIAILRSTPNIRVVECADPSELQQAIAQAMPCV